ncbi:MAG: c-type cytochrome biogenesis protein CcsB [Proteobacteria bacterium]|nr:c-type cytochrome biogenesis protein CcsB [Pseudomonadota bacterium]MBU1708596.1 c-type cytochrome biogenesis protein CcsB [Pseudomonadota bacterium]
MNLLFSATFLCYILATAAYVVFFFSQNKKIRLGARSIFFVAGVLHFIYLIVRYVAAGHTPLTSNHEAVSFFALTITWAFLSFRWRHQVKNFGTFVSPVVTLLMLVAVLSSKHIKELPPALQSNWLPVHASIALMAYGFLALAFCGGIMYLLQEREIKKKSFGLFYSRLPSLDALDSLNHHCLAIGFPLMTLGIITGSIWARQAWGTYWQWDPKETWSLITWFIYAALLHQRLTVGWRGKRAAIMSIIGFSAVLFTLWGVSFLLSGLHSYVG